MSSSLLNQIKLALGVLRWTKEQIDEYKQEHDTPSAKKSLRPGGDPTRGLPAILSQRTYEAYLETSLTFFQRAKELSMKGLLSELFDPAIILATFDTYYIDMMPNSNKTVLAALEKVFLGCRRLRWIRTPSPITNKLRKHVHDYRDDGDAHIPRFGYKEEDAPMIVELMHRKKSQFALAAEIALRCGLRLDELAGLRGANIHGEIDSMHIKGKGGKERDIPIPHDLVERLDISRQYIFVPSATWKNSCYMAVRRAARELEIKISGVHRFRGNKAQDRYEELRAKGLTDTEARDIVAREFGHNRRDVTYSYIPKGYRKP